MNLGGSANATALHYQWPRPLVELSPLRELGGEAPWPFWINETVLYFFFFLRVFFCKSSLSCIVSFFRQDFGTSVVRSRSDWLPLPYLSLPFPLRLFGDGPWDVALDDLVEGGVVVEFVIVCVGSDSAFEVSNVRNGGSGEQSGWVDGGKIPSISGEMGPWYAESEAGESGHKFFWV